MARCKKSGLQSSEQKVGVTQAGFRKQWKVRKKERYAVRNIMKGGISKAVILQWLADNYRASETMCIPRDLVFEHYCLMCKETGSESERRSVIGKLIFEQFPHIKLRRFGSRGASRNFYWGLAAVTSNDLFDDFQKQKRVSIIPIRLPPRAQSNGEKSHDKQTSLASKVSRQKMTGSSKKLGVDSSVTTCSATTTNPTVTTCSARTTSSMVTTCSARTTIPTVTTCSARTTNPTVTTCSARTSSSMVTTCSARTTIPTVTTCSARTTIPTVTTCSMTTPISTISSPEATSTTETTCATDITCSAEAMRSACSSVRGCNATPGVGAGSRKRAGRGRRKNSRRAFPGSPSSARYHGDVSAQSGHDTGSDVTRSSSSGRVVSVHPLELPAPCGADRQITQTGMDPRDKSLNPHSGVDVTDGAKVTGTTNVCPETSDVGVRILRGLSASPTAHHDVSASPSQAEHVSVEEGDMDTRMESRPHTDGFTINDHRAGDVTTKARRIDDVTTEAGRIDDVTTEARRIDDVTTEARRIDDVTKQASQMDDVTKQDNLTADVTIEDNQWPIDVIEKAQLRTNDVIVEERPITDDVTGTGGGLCDPRTWVCECSQCRRQQTVPRGTPGKGRTPPRPGAQHSRESPRLEDGGARFSACDGGRWQYDQHCGQHSDLTPDLNSDLYSSLTSGLPSRILSDLPSDLPSNLSSDLTSDLASGRLSGLPSDLPFDLTSDLTSGRLSGLPSDLPWDLHSGSPKLPNITDVKSEAQRDNSNSLSALTLAASIEDVTCKLAKDTDSCSAQLPCESLSIHGQETDREPACRCPRRRQPTKGSREPVRNWPRRKCREQAMSSTGREPARNARKPPGGGPGNIGCSASREVAALWKASEPEQKKAHREETKEWVSCHYEMDPRSCIPRQVVYEHYVQDTLKRGVKVTAPMGILGRVLLETFPLLDMRRLGARNNSRYYYLGINIRPESAAYKWISAERVISQSKPKLSRVFNGPPAKAKTSS